MGRLISHIVPLGLLAWVVLSYAPGLGDYEADRLLVLRSGFVGLGLLIASFATTPLLRALRQRVDPALRRRLGLYAFLFIALHVFAYAWRDNDFNLRLMARDLFERRAMGVGMLAFAALVPLAATSTRGWQRRLGRRWRTLHRLIFVALPFAVLHFLLLDRDVLTVAYLMLAITIAMLLLRFRQSGAQFSA